MPSTSVAALFRLRTTQCIRNAFQFRYLCFYFRQHSLCVQGYPSRRVKAWIVQLALRPEQGLGDVSMDGKFFIFTSDWDNQLGWGVDGTPPVRCLHRQA